MPVPSSIIVIYHMWLISPQGVSNEAEELNFYFSFFELNLNVCVIKLQSVGL